MKDSRLNYQHSLDKQCYNHNSTSRYGGSPHVGSHPRYSDLRYQPKH